MSGHSKWSTIKHAKAITDKKRGALFTKLANAITIAAKNGGDPQTNFKLRVEIDKARSQNMPSANIDRAIKRGTGELLGELLEEITYEAFGPSGIAILILVLTNNKNRSVSDIKNILSKFGGKFASEGAVKHLFEQKGVVIANSKSQMAHGKDEIELLAIDAGAQDLDEQNDTLLIYTKPNELFAVKKSLEEKGIKVESASLSMEPRDTIKIQDKETAQKILKLMNAIDEHEDVCNSCANFEIEEEIIK